MAEIHDSCSLSMEIQGIGVFIMTFTALTGAASHMVIGGLPDIWCLVFCVVFTLLWARIAAKFANRASLGKQRNGKSILLKDI